MPNGFEIYPEPTMLGGPTTSTKKSRAKNKRERQNKKKARRL